jgi:hypothetical protein
VKRGFNVLDHLLTVIKKNRLIFLTELSMFIIAALSIIGPFCYPGVTRHRTFTIHSCRLFQKDIFLEPTNWAETCLSGFYAV